MKCAHLCCGCMNILWPVLLETGTKIHLFQSCSHCQVFQFCWHIKCSTFTASSFSIWTSSAGIPSPPLALFVVMPTWLHTPGFLAPGDLWLSGSLCPFLYSFSVYFCHLFLIPSASVSVPFLSFIVAIFAWNIPLDSNFLEELSSLSHSTFSLYFFALITEES